MPHTHAPRDSEEALRLAIEFRGLLFLKNEKKPCSKEKDMYRKTCQNKELPEIGLYFAGRLNPENRWVKIADLLPCEEVESEYARYFKSHG